jgi:general secretion pathway protein I
MSVSCSVKLSGRVKQSGFTLLEVLVAMALIGIAFSTAFVAISGARQLTEKSAIHESALILARAKLDEVLSSKDYLLTEEGGEDHYSGQKFGYQIKVRPVNIFSGDGIEKLAMPFMLEDVGIEVFWGPQGSQQSYRLSTLRYSAKQVKSGQGSTEAQLGQVPHQTGH